MSGTADIFAWLGIRIPDLVAGFMGGVVNALFFSKGRPIDVVASLVGGALTANYLTTPVAHIGGLDEGVAGFIVGVTAMAICQSLFSVANSWTARIVRGTDAGQ
jgi:hypothetical protein